MSTSTKSRTTVTVPLMEVSPKDFRLGDTIVIGHKRDNSPIFSGKITEYEVNPRGCKGNVHVKCQDGNGSGCYAIVAKWEIVAR